MPTVLVGGVRTVTEILSNKFKERGHNVTWMLLHRIYNDDRDFPNDQQYFYLPDSNMMSEDNVRCYHKFIEEHNIDIIINQNGLYEGVNLIDTAKNKQVKIISVLHNNPILGYDWVWEDALILRNHTFTEKLKLVARIVLYRRTRKRLKTGITEQFNSLKEGGSHINVLSPAYIETIKKFAPDLRNVSAIANPNVYSDVNSCKKEKIVLYVGRIDNRAKRIQLLIKIWNQIEDKVKDWRLIIVGEGPDREVLEKASKKSDRIEFVGYQNPRKYYEKASILCMTSLYEGFPMTLTEAMQHGCVPVVYDSFPAAHDIISPGEDGEIITPFDTKDYSKVLLNMMLDGTYLNKLSNQARISVKRYDCDKIIDQWEELFRKLRDR